MNKQIARALVALLLTLNCTAAFTQTVREPDFCPSEWVDPYPPFRVAGNLYYVGTYDLACYLITTPDGHFLINTGVASSDRVIKANVERLGFKMEDIRVLLTNQAHWDHVGAMGSVQKMTGARFLVNQGDYQVMADGGVTDYMMGRPEPLFVPVKADKELKDGDTISLGGTVVTAIHHPGHTKGSTSFRVNVSDSSRAYTVLIANMPSVIIEGKFAETTTYPGMAGDYAKTFASMENQKFDLWVAAHASQFDLHKKRKPTDGYNPSIYADRDLYLNKLAALKEEYEKRK